MALEDVLAQQVESGIFSLSVDLQPLRSADEVATLLLSLRRYPDGFPNRLEKVADDLGGTYSVEQLTGLLERLVARSAGFMLLSSSLPPDGPTVYLIPPVSHCVACSAAPPLVVRPDKRREPQTSPVVITDAGVRAGVLHQKLCLSCGAVHSMSYAEGGTEIPAGKQMPYAKATSPETRYVQLKKGYVFENSLVKGYEAQALFSHTGFQTWVQEFQWKTGCRSPSVDALRKALAYTWLAWSLLKWLDEHGEPPTAMALTAEGTLDATLLEELRRDGGLHRLFVDKWGTRHEAICRKPCQGESWCRAFVADGHMKCHRQASE